MGDLRLYRYCVLNLRCLRRGTNNVIFGRGLKLSRPGRLVLTYLALMLVQSLDIPDHMRGEHLNVCQTALLCLTNSRQLSFFTI